MPLLLLLLIPMGIIQAEKEDLEPGFHIGRISEGQFEYPRLNGWMTPPKAAILCEEDPQCGGFTYKGTYLPERQFQVFFFHLLINLETELGAWKWNFYRANKTYLQFPGKFASTDPLEDEKPGSLVDCSKDVSCVGVELPTHHLLSYLDLDSLRKVPGVTTMVKALDVHGDTNIDSGNSWENLDLCCPKSGKVTDAQVAKIHDHLERVPCDMDQEEFVARYVMQREPVILVNCSASWHAQAEWTLENLLKVGEGNKAWRCDWELRKQGEGSKFKVPDDESLKGSMIQEIIRRNGTLRIFDKLGRRMHTMARHNGTTLATDKLHLFNDYSTPQPLHGVDKFDKAGVLTDYQWIIASHKNTGTELHTDPDFTSPWNTVLKGHKWWVLMPPEVLPDAFLCDESCSKGKEDDINVLSWYTHVLPQIRHRKFYGNKVKEFVQGPGETIYMPGHLAHAVMNIDENLSVTENLFLPDSLEDWVHGMMAGEDLVSIEDDSPGAREEERFWKSMYFSQLDAGERALVRGMRTQVEKMMLRYPEGCDEEEEEEEEEEGVEQEDRGDEEEEEEDE